jgi:hypothetical protein
MNEFIRSIEGKSFFSSFRKMVKSIEEIAIELKRANDLKEEELSKHV